MRRKPTMAPRKKAEEGTHEPARSLSPGGAERMRAYRARQAAGRVVLKVEVDAVAVEEWLIAAGYLNSLQADDQKALAKAVADVLADWSGGA